MKIVATSWILRLKCTKVDFDTLVELRPTALPQTADTLAGFKGGYF